MARYGVPQIVNTDQGSQFTSQTFTGLLKEHAIALASLARLDPDSITFEKNLKNKPDGHVSLVVGSIDIYLPLADLVDPAEERGRLKSDLKETQNQIDRLEKLLESDFAKKAPEQVVQMLAREL